MGNRVGSTPTTRTKRKGSLRVKTRGLSVPVKRSVWVRPPLPVPSRRKPARGNARAFRSCGQPCGFDPHYPYQAKRSPRVKTRGLSVPVGNRVGSTPTTRTRQEGTRAWKRAGFLFICHPFPARSACLRLSMEASRLPQKRRHWDGAPKAAAPGQAESRRFPGGFRKSYRVVTAPQRSPPRRCAASGEGTPLLRPGSRCRSRRRSGGRGRSAAASRPASGGPPGPSRRREPP